MKKSEIEQIEHDRIHDPIKYLEGMAKYHREQYEKQWKKRIEDAETDYEKFMLKEMKRLESFIAEAIHMSTMWGVNIKIDTPPSPPAEK